MSVQKPTAAETAYWERILASEGLHQHAGNPHKRLLYVEDTDLYQTKKTRPGTKGGRLSGYRLGEKRCLTITCQHCGRAFTAKRKTAKFCSSKCRHWEIWNGHLPKNVNQISEAKDGENGKC